MPADYSSIITDDWQGFFPNRPVGSVLLDGRSYVVFLDNDGLQYILHGEGRRYGTWIANSDRSIESLLVG